MALLKCPKCDHEVPSTTTECPKCGLIFKKYQEGILKAQKHKEQKQNRERAEQQKKLMPCSACKNSISKRTRVCPKCGEPQEQSTDFDPNQVSSLVDIFWGIFDFQYNLHITPNLVKISYFLFVLLLPLISLVNLMAYFSVHEIFSFSGILAIGGTILGVIFAIIVLRITCESALLLFRIEENTR